MITSSQLIITYLLLLLGAMFVFIALGHILYQKRSPTSMVAWITSVIFLPFIAVPFYFLIGARKERYHKRYVDFHNEMSNQDYNVTSFEHSIFNLSEKNGIPSATRHNTFQLITDDREAYNIMLEEIEKAEKSIDICTYEFQFDESTHVILEALVRKAQEGVKVRLLLDTVGSLAVYLNQKNFAELKRYGGEVAFFTSLFKKPYLNYISLRNHRKIYLFDQTRVISGGMNLSNAYMGEKSTSKSTSNRYKGLLYLLTGPSVIHFYHIFHSDWCYAVKEEEICILPTKKEYSGENILQVVPSGPDIPSDGLYEALLNAFYNAKKRIWMVTPYFIPDENIMQALIIAHRKGVEVKLITPKESDHLFVDIVRMPYIRELHDIGVDVILYENRVLHAKAMLIDDDKSMVGSVNMDNRSLFFNYEVVTFIDSVETQKHIEIWMESLICEGTRNIQPPSRVREGVENIMKVFAPIL
ncbi:MAG: Cardiolipin synthetase (EC [uncultured Sulfurovum sp.]|uniref:Cardiolipin synthetase (EC) n=1 Tax=uncultured Sulfurovum sp. TaxID=269237 RepID=A0A6S6U1V2_9BACT|nr:MAG: Cardiolipin synthetase (EC [uncultured Sulfurovum sp.]